MKLKGIKLSGTLSAGKLMVYLTFLLVAALLAMGVFFFITVQQEAGDREYINKIGDQRVLSQEIAKLSSWTATMGPARSSWSLLRTSPSPI